MPLCERPPGAAFAVSPQVRVWAGTAEKPVPRPILYLGAPPTSSRTPSPDNTVCPFYQLPLALRLVRFSLAFNDFLFVLRVGQPISSSLRAGPTPLYVFL